MAEQRIIWTALPNGTSVGGGLTGTLKLSVFVTPRLTDASPTPTLSLFNDWLDWPAAVAAVVWRVHINAGSFPGTVVSAAPVSARWTDVFGPSSRVESYQFLAVHDGNVNSYPATKLWQYLLARYTDLAVGHGDEYPTVDALLGTESGLSGLLQEVAYRQDPQRPGTGPFEPAVLSQLQNAMAGARLSDPVNRNAALPDPGVAGNDWPLYFEQHKQFLRREPPAALPPADPVPPSLDFHQAVAAFGDHPPLLRVLGLAVDLEVRDHPPIAPTGEVWVEPQWTPTMPPGATTNVLPHTYYDSRFLPAPGASGNDVQAGLLRLDSGEYELLPVDVDGAAIKVTEFATAIARATAPVALGGSGSTDTPDRYATPALRTGGIGLVRSGRAARLVANLATATGLDGQASQNPPAPVFLGSDDVTRGYRIDVWDDTRSRWEPLCARVAGPSLGYQFLKSSVTLPVPAGDEGIVSLGLTGNPDGLPDDQYLGELMARWRGWSLVAPRPGKGLGKGPHDPLQAVDTVPAGPDVPVQVSYSPTPGTLPTLRFGHSYRMRARAVDLAGNSLPFDGSSPSGPFPSMSPPVFYGRLEPVVSPFVVLRKENTEGESVERLVIRSTRYDADDNTVVPTERHVASPRTAELMAEEHGVLDSGNVPDTTKYAMIGARESAQFPGGVNTPANYNQPHFDVDTLVVPYLPDVFARGAALKGLPGVPVSTPMVVPFRNPPSIDWPDSASFRIKMVAGPDGTPPQAPTFVDRTLVVTVPKAVIAHVRISSVLDPADLDQMQLWHSVLDRGLPAAQLNALRSLVLDGGHWMFTPWRELLFIHAVRQPLTPPVFGADFVASRDHEGQTDALLEGHLGVDLKSTLRVDLHAEWDEFVDADPVPGTVVARAVPVTLTLSPDDPDGDQTQLGVGIRADTRHQFGDTKHRFVYYEAIAGTRFAEYFVERATPSLSGTAASVLDGAGIVAGQETVTSSDRTLTYRRDVDYTVDETAGSIARLPNSAIPDNTPLKVAYVAAPITRSSLEAAESPPSPRGHRVNVLSSSRPATPDVRSVLPTFAWEAPSVPSNQKASVRRGNGLRVYLGRTWGSSGDGELLGVVMAQSPLIPQSDPAKSFVTMWGRDPVWITSAIAYSPTPGDFPLASHTAGSVLLREFGNVAVAGHPVAYDPDRELWYSDIEFSANAQTSYWPFVRLGLARYQPDSLDQPFSDGGLFLSPVVLADFAQLAPDRGVNLTFFTPPPNANAKRIDVRVFGPAPFTPSGASNEVVVQVQQLRPNVDPADDLAWVDVGAGHVLAFNNLLVPTWSGTLQLPAPRNSRPFRLAIVESELMPQDGGGVGRRLVFVDTIRV